VTPHATPTRSRRKDPLGELSELVQRETGIRMPAEKRTLLQCRLERRLRVLGIDTLQEYIAHLERERASELQALIDVVTTNKTDFYREPSHFKYLLQTALPKLLNTVAPKQLRVWCAGCSSGEEAYTLAMTVSEALRERPGVDFRILATDISARVMELARKGIYHQTEIAPLPTEWRERYTAPSKDKKKELARVRLHLRRRVSFHHLNFMDAQYPAPQDFHIVFFRNVAIYFERPVQQAVVRKLSSHLVRGGYLFMGHSESLQTRIEGLESRGASIFERV
jgi:chemotaxis protein methyltransferase CheR